MLLAYVQNQHVVLRSVITAYTVQPVQGWYFRQRPVEFLQFTDDILSAALVKPMLQLHVPAQLARYKNKYHVDIKYKSIRLKTHRGLILRSGRRLLLVPCSYGCLSGQGLDLADP